MTEAEKDARIELLEAVVVDMWHEHVEPFLLDPKYGNRFYKIDRKVRELGLSSKLKR